MYFCSGFLVLYDYGKSHAYVDHLINIREYYKQQYPGFDYHLFHQRGLQKFAFFANLEQRGEFEEDICAIFINSEDGFGLLHCQNDEYSTDLMYTLVYYPHGPMVKYGDPFFSPMSEHLIWDGKPHPLMQRKTKSDL